MRLSSRILIPVLSAILGFGCGIAFVAWRAARWTNEFIEGNSRLSTFQRVRLLRQLRSNKNAEAITEQEILLAGDISSLGFIIKEGRSKDLTLPALKKAYDYQKQFPDSFQFGNLRQQVNNDFTLIQP